MFTWDSAKNEENKTGPPHCFEDAVSAFEGPDPSEPRRARKLRRRSLGGQKRPIYIRLDQEVLDYFQREGVRGYQSRINAVLRFYVRVMQPEPDVTKVQGAAGARR